MATRGSVLDLLNAGIEALAHADVSRLERLFAAAAEAGLPETAAQQTLARARLRTLGYLLVLTRRNLRLLRGIGYRAYGRIEAEAAGAKQRQTGSLRRNRHRATGTN